MAVHGGSARDCLMQPQVVEDDEQGKRVPV